MITSYPAVTSERKCEICGKEMRHHGYVEETEEIICPDDLASRVRLYALEHKGMKDLAAFLKSMEPESFNGFLARLQGALSSGEYPAFIPTENLRIKIFRVIAEMELW